MGVRFLELGSCGMASGRKLKGEADGLGFGEWLGVLLAPIHVVELVVGIYASWWM